MNASTTAPASSAYAADPLTGELPPDVHQRHHLVAVLFEGGKLSLRHAIDACAAQDADALADGIDHASNIIGSGLKASLDIHQGGELAERLDALYDYMLTRLEEARSTKDADTLSEVLELLGNISSAWQQIGSRSVALAA